MEKPTISSKIPLLISIIINASLVILAVNGAGMSIQKHGSAATSQGGLRGILFSDSMLYQHFLSPVIAIAGFLLLEKEPHLSFRMTFFAMIPTLIYAVVLYPLNIAGVVDGPYPFLQVRKNTVGNLCYVVLYCAGTGVSSGTADLACEPED